MYAGLADRKKLAHYKLSDSRAPRWVAPPPPPPPPTAAFPLLIPVLPFRYLCNEHVKPGPDMGSNASYREHFNAVEQCFKVIGFTLEVRGRRPPGGKGAGSRRRADVSAREQM